MSKKIAIIGNGINGLLEALFLASDGHDVTIFSDKSPFSTTTIAAGAIWMPYKALPEEKVLQWAQKSLEYYKKISEDPNSGVILRTHTEFFSIASEKPTWMDLLSEGDAPNCNIPSDAESSYSVIIPMIDTTKLVSYILNKLDELNVYQVELKIVTLTQLEEFNIIVNSSGSGASVITKDETLYPIKGQTFTLSQPTPRITQSVFYDRDNLVTLVVPHENHVTIGVTYCENDDSTDYDLLAEDALLDSAQKFFPQLSDSHVISRRVGTRPGRTNGIRLEEEYLEDSSQWIVHNYGHAGGGITLAPGCANEVLERVNRISNEFGMRIRR